LKSMVVFSMLLAPGGWPGHADASGPTAPKITVGSPAVKIATSTQPHPSTAISCSPSYVSNLFPPGQIRVYRSQLGIVQTYDLNYYVKNVLPNEWIVSWQSPEAFKAGAAAVLDYAWKLINGGGYVAPNGQCADVDDTVNFQVFRPGSAVQATSDAVDTVWEWLTRSAGAIFLSQYRAGCPGVGGNCPPGQSDACGQLYLAPAPGNIMSQYGTLACANQGYTWQQIITTYYLPNYFPSIGFVGIGYGPAVTAWTVGNEIDLFVRASDDTVRWNPGIGNPVGWIGWYSLGAPAGGATSDPAVVWWQGNTRLDVFVRGGDYQLYDAYSIDGGPFTAWQFLGGNPTSGPAAAATAGGSRLDLFIRGGDNNLWQRTLNGSIWTGWASVAPGHTFTSTPGAAWWQSDGRLDVFVRGGDNQVWENTTFGTIGSNWIGFSLVGTGDLSSGPSVTASGNRIDIFGRGTDNLVYERTWNGQWTGWSGFAGQSQSRPVATWWQSGSRLDMFIRGTDNPSGMYWNYWTGNWTGWQGMGVYP
jgi:hypothetical protein